MEVEQMPAQLFSDLLPGAAGSDPSYLVTHNGYLYFASSGVDTSWMVLPRHRDLCGSFRQSAFDSRVFYAVSNHTTWLPGRTYDCPAGYHWASTEEGYRYFTSTGDASRQRFWHSDGGAEIGQRHGPQGYSLEYRTRWEQATSIESGANHERKTYADECGWDAFSWFGQDRVRFLFSDSHTTGAYKHAGRADSMRQTWTLRVLWSRTSSLVSCVWPGMHRLARVTRTDRALPYRGAAARRPGTSSGGRTAPWRGP
jgi:hypothetical protein